MPQYPDCPKHSGKEGKNYGLPHAAFVNGNVKISKVEKKNN